MNSDGVQATTDELSDLIPVFAQVAESIATPAFVYEEEFIRHRCEHIRKIADQAGCRLLYSLKALTLPWVLDLISPHVLGTLVGHPRHIPGRTPARPPQEGSAAYITRPGIPE